MPLQPHCSVAFRRRRLSCACSCSTRICCYSNSLSLFHTSRVPSLAWNNSATYKSATLRLGRGEAYNVKRREGMKESPSSGGTSKGENCPSIQHRAAACSCSCQNVRKKQRWLFLLATGMAAGAADAPRGPPAVWFAVKPFVFGGLAASFATACIQPVDFLKVGSQARPGQARPEAFTHKGVRVCWPGAAATGG